MNLRRAKIAAGLVLLSPYVPMIFQGEEWAASAPFQYFTQHEDEALARAVSQGRRHEFKAFGWDPERVPDPQDPETFERSKLDWSERDESPHAEMLEWYRDLIALRREYPSLSNGERKHMGIQYDVSDQWLVMERAPVTVVCNFSNGGRCIPVDTASNVILASDAGVEITTCGVRMPPESLSVLQSQ